MTAPGSTVLLGCGTAFPPTDQEAASDPSERFTGVGRRHVLVGGEEAEDLSVDACLDALARAGVAADAVDRLYGYVSVARYPTPNPLYRVHERIGLRPDALVVPINSEFSNFVVGLLQATESATAGGCRHALVVAGSGWTRNVDPTQEYAVAASDAAGAALLGPGAGFAAVGSVTHTRGKDYERMTMALRPRHGSGVPRPTYHMDIDLYDYLRDGVPTVVRELLERYGVRAQDVTLITHQGSRALLDHWADAVRPGAYPDTLAEHGNMTSATYPVTLAEHLPHVRTPHVVVAAVGTGLHITALLLSRGGPTS
ncbi:3-oxoacyl-[acyl-carrier-protein] synthase III C-terminal domain-containing protein [Isoptericola halotolerans]|uniref:3-oxoacyl-[acyl-carrier-protein] synthase III C-terminal domain-containing protein n=1 Tax=Isoptericola halotolerans TaxID=300560 RepID=UPI00388FBCFC